MLVLCNSETNGIFGRKAGAGGNGVQTGIACAGSKEMKIFRVRPISEIVV